MTTPALAALAFLPGAVLIGIWVAYSDLSTMKIPNKAVMALTVLFAVIGVLVLPLPDYLWRYSHLAIVLVIGFLLNMIRLLGAGDAKFAAAMAPYIARQDLGSFLLLFCLVVVAAVVIHRVLRRIPAVRNATPEWASWTHKKFPLGFALGPVLALYLGLAALPLING